MSLRFTETFHFDFAKIPVWLPISCTFGDGKFGIILGFARGTKPFEPYFFTKVNKFSKIFKGCNFLRSSMFPRFYVNIAFSVLLVLVVFFSISYNISLQNYTKVK